MRRIQSLGALGEGSGWDLRIRPAPAPPAPGNLGTWKSENLEIWGPGNPEIWGPKNQKKLSNIKSVLPKMSARSGLDEKKKLLALFGAIPGNFSMGRTKKNRIFCLFSLVGQWALFTRFGPLLLSTRGGEIGKIQACPVLEQFARQERESAFHVASY